MDSATQPVLRLDWSILNSGKTATSFTSSSRTAPDLTWEIGTLNFHRPAPVQVQVKSGSRSGAFQSPLKTQSSNTMNGAVQIAKPKPKPYSRPKIQGGTNSTRGVPRSSASDSPEVVFIHTIFNTGNGNQAGPSSRVGSVNSDKPSTSTGKGISGLPPIAGGSHSSGSRGSAAYGQASSPSSVIDPSWELIDPTPDVFALFMEFNRVYFSGMLGSVTVEWSPRMTSCAGICRYSTRNKECKISLSKPLLTLRPRKDLVETLLHEMIHAKLFLKPEGGKHDRSGHGEDFQNHMKRINAASGAHITVYHSFHDEVNHYKTHWWQCFGRCRENPPFFGLVKRSMNRAPGPNDLWFPNHQATCGGTFVKIREPPKKQKSATTPKKPAPGKTTKKPSGTSKASGSSK